MITTALHFASVALNTDPVPKPIELSAGQKYSILAEQGRHGQRIKSWVKRTTYFRTICLREIVGSHAQSNPAIFANGNTELRKWRFELK